MSIFQQMTGPLSPEKKVSHPTLHLPADIHYHHSRNYRFDSEILNDAIRIADPLLSIHG